MTTLDQAMFNMCKKGIKQKVYEILHEDSSKDLLSDIFENQHIKKEVYNIFEKKKIKIEYKTSTRSNEYDSYESALNVILKVTDSETNEVAHVALKGWWSSYNGNEYQNNWSFVEPKTKVVTYYE
jgi:hypothetical protein